MGEDELKQILVDHKLWLDGSGGKRANLVGARLDRARLVGANLDGAWLDRARLDGANLDNASLVDASLVRARLVDANLDNASFVGARLDGASLDRASLVRARLVRASLVRASFVGARLVDANLDGARFSDTNLSCTTGLIWCQTGPIGHGRRTLTGVFIDNQIMLFAGCFAGTQQEFVAKCDNGGWGWDEVDIERLSEECKKACEHVVKNIESQGKHG